MGLGKTKNSWISHVPGEALSITSMKFLVYLILFHLFLVTADEFLSEKENLCLLPFLLPMPNDLPSHSSALGVGAIALPCVLLYVGEVVAGIMDGEQKWSRCYHVFGLCVRGGRLILTSIFRELLVKVKTDIQYLGIFSKGE